jgi:mRNA interferase RelE/StbE
VASYKILFKPSVEKDLSAIPRKLAVRVMRRIEQLGENPFLSGCMKLSGSEGLYRARVSDYRIVYEADTTTQAITIHYVRHRREVYRKL